MADRDAIHRLIGQLLDVPAPQRTEWLARELPDDPSLRQLLIAAVDGPTEVDSGDGRSDLLFNVHLDSPRQPPLKIAHYEVIGPLGSGGMGEVYRAHDMKLGRDVALKVLPREMSDDPERRMRLLREARAAAALNHPNICTIHEVGEAEGHLYIAMEVIEGQPLSSRLAGGPLALEDSLRYGLELAEALAHAHDRGVVHRDLKSANVMLTPDGRVKVLDFGLAKRSSRRELADVTTRLHSLTQPGAIIGTLPYMAPEQLRGQPADARSDVWALGVILYEMASGALPFQGDTGFELSSAIFHETPSPLPAQMAPLQAVTSRCLEKDPDRRFQSADEVRLSLRSSQLGMVAPAAASQQLSRRPRLVSALQGAIAAALLGLLAFALTDYSAPLKRQISRLMTSPSSASDDIDTLATSGANGHKTLRRSVALLGFNNASGREAVAYISTALDQGLGSDLAVGQRLRIVSGEEISRMKQDLRLTAGETLALDTLRKVSASLGIDVVVTGSYTAVGTPGESQVRVDIRVQDTQSGQLIGAVSATGTETELLALISESGAVVRRTLGLAGVEAQQTANAALPVSLGARRLYAEGLDALRHFDAKRARDLFERSISQEPDFALAHVGLANAWSILGYDSQAVREAAAATGLAQALRKEDRTWIEGLYREYTREWGSAIAAYRTLVMDYPDQPEYALKLADAQTSAGTPKDALITLATLTNTVPGAKDDPRVLLAEASAAETLGDARRQETASRAAIVAAERQGARLLVARASIALARALQLLGNVTAATETNETARRLFEEAGDRRGVARALVQLGTLSRESGDLKKAELTLRTALDTSRDIGNKRQTTQSLNELANVYFDLRRFGSAADMYSDAVSVSRELGDQGAEARALGNLASARYEQGNVVEAQRLDEQALAIKRAIGDQRSIAFSLINIAETSADLGKLDAAQKMYEESRAINEKLNAKIPLSYSLSGLSTVALRRDQLPLAQEMIEKALQLRTEAKDGEGVLDAEISLANVLFERGNVTAASEVLKRLGNQIEKEAPEQAARAAVLRAALLVRQGQMREGRSALSAILRHSTDGYSAATSVAIELEDARLLAAAGETSAAVAKARQLAVRSRMRGLLAFELEANLVLATTAPSDRKAVSELVQRARAASFALIARKAETLLAATASPSDVSRLRGSR